jgi:hypothetical protein
MPSGGSKSSAMPSWRSRTEGTSGGEITLAQPPADQVQCEIIQGRAAGKLLAPSLPRLVLRMDFPPQHEQPAPCAAFI